MIEPVYGAHEKPPKVTTVPGGHTNVCGEGHPESETVSLDARN